MIKFLAFMPLAFLISCGPNSKTTPVKTEYQTVYVNVPAPCPEKAVGEDLIASRPVPLKDTPKPPTADVRSAKMVAQLGKYEAKGGWADKVVAALTRCQQGGQ